MDDPPNMDQVKGIVSISVNDTIDRLLMRLGFDPNDREELAQVRRDIGFLRKLREKSDRHEKLSAELYESGRKNVVQQVLAGLGWAIPALAVGIAGALGWRGHIP